MQQRTHLPPLQARRKGLARRVHRLGARLALAGALVAAAGCGGKRAAPPPAGGLPEVAVVTVQPAQVALTQELPGRTSPYRIAEVRARVSGIVQRRLFTEGADVKAGQRLFQLDAAPYQAALDSARAQLARAEASAASARLQDERTAALVEAKAVSRQERDDALAARKAADADVAAARAAVQSARINLGYTDVTSPLTGRIGRAAVTEGAYAQQAQATLLATVQQLDPIYVDVTQSSAELARLRGELAAGRLSRAGGGARVKLVLEDGTEYAQAGALQFSDVTVDPGTGSVALRALFPNPKGELLPGMFVRARVEEGVEPQALTVPQSAVQRDARARATVFVVAAGDQIEAREVRLGRTVGASWVVAAGLAPGERVVVEGLQKIRPGAKVRPVAAPALAAVP
ncbi:efflux RND transporter periplasmic adaptor subunit [Anaeromyxobacter paludicola]|uniref:MexX family efflux pump subunit n=1 Tax=Anaeromyxobacter paludicola TaxID=2918171 RepID=A0ABN6NDH8_9BACT|nr:efflux RND transporter periplasmic adaptor subunit [Anaeromyxobacter paludicola]BDG10048.1 MexX family efflux pump subunit [Anaeromyxobacter paludicola]